MMRICFVCSGNICRSPSAEVVMRALLQAEHVDQAVEVSSAGLGDWHVGEHADHRSLAELAARGYDGSLHRARQFEAAWFDEHDLVVAMDHVHLRELRRLAPPGGEHKIALLMSFTGSDADLPDPYYGGVDGFARVLDMVEAGCRALLDSLRQQLSA